MNELQELKRELQLKDNIIELREQEIELLKNELSEKELDNKILKNTTSQKFHESLLEKLENVSNKLSIAESQVSLFKEFIRACNLENEYKKWCDFGRYMS